MREKLYDVRLNVYGEKNCMITFGNGIDFAQEVGAQFVEVKVIDTRLVFIPHSKMVYGVTVCVSDNRVQMANPKKAKEVKDFVGEFRLRKTENGLRYIDLEDRVMLIENSKCVYRREQKRVNRRKRSEMRDGYENKEVLDLTKPVKRCEVVAKLPNDADFAERYGVLYLSLDKMSIEDALRIGQIRRAKEIRFDIRREVI